METQESPLAALVKIDRILQDELAAAKKRRPELKDAQWLDDETLFRIVSWRPASCCGFIHYIGVIDQQKGDVRLGVLMFGWRTRAPRIRPEERIRDFLDTFADALRDGTITPQQIIPATKG